MQADSAYFLVEETIENHARGKCADDRSKFRHVGEPRQQQGKADTKQELEIADSEASQATHDSRCEPDADPQRSNKEKRGLSRGLCDGEEADSSRDRESTDNSKHDQTQHIVNYSSTQDDARFFGVFAAKVAENAGGNTHTGG